MYNKDTVKQIKKVDIDVRLDVRLRQVISSIERLLHNIKMVLRKRAQCCDSPVVTLPCLRNHGILCFSFAIYILICCSNVFPKCVAEIEKESCGSS